GRDPADRRRPGQRLLQGHGAAGPGVGGGPQEVGVAGPRRGRADRDLVRPVRGRSGLTTRPVVAAGGWSVTNGRGWVTMAQVATDRCAEERERPVPPGPYRRVVLKLSGENFGGGQLGVDPDVVQSFARQIATVVRTGVQVAVVV